MEKTVLTSVGAAYEPPYAEIIEFAVEAGFAVSGIDPDGYDRNDGTEAPGRDDVTEPWY